MNFVSIPNFIIIGVQKGGTTSLYNYLIQHPRILPATQKELQFFSLNFSRGVSWYLSQFSPQVDGDHLLTGEASPYYIFHPHTPQRIYKTFPKVKLIALLRNPVKRALSHYIYYYYTLKEQGLESLSLPEAIQQESQRLNGELAKMLADPDYDSYNYRHYSYLTRGIYVDQLLHWFKIFPREQLLILKSEDLYQNPSATVNQVLDFLELPSLELPMYHPYNSSTHDVEISPEFEQDLQEFFRPHNQRLVELLGNHFKWEESLDLD